MVISKYEVDFSKWSPETNLSFNEFIFLSLLMSGNSDFFDKFKNSQKTLINTVLNDLQSKGWIKIIDDGIEMRQLALDLFKVSNVNASD